MEKEIKESNKVIKLTNKHKLFCEKYLLTNNQTRAYMEVYNVKENTASVNACKLLKRDDIREYIERVKQGVYLTNIDEVEKVLTILKNIYEGKTRAKKHFKIKGELVEVEVEPTVSERIKAIQTYATILGYNHAYGSDYYYKVGNNFNSGANEDAW